MSNPNCQCWNGLPVPEEMTNSPTEVHVLSFVQKRDLVFRANSKPGILCEHVSDGHCFLLTALLMPSAGGVVGYKFSSMSSLQWFLSWTCTIKAIASRERSWWTSCRNTPTRSNTSTSRPAWFSRVAEAAATTRLWNVSLQRRITSPCRSAPSSSPSGPQTWSTTRLVPHTFPPLF